MLNKIKQKHSIALIISLLTALLAGQIVACFHIRTALQELKALAAAAGTSAVPFVPDLNVLQPADRFATVFSGALFIALSVAVALWLITLFAVRFLDRMINSKNLRVVLLVCGWIVLAILLHNGRFSPWISAYVIAVPFATVLTFRFLSSSHSKRSLDIRRIILAGLFLLIVSIAAGHAGSNLFVSFRDRILFSHPVGTRLVDFYYRYSFYPAYAVSSLSQRPTRLYSFKPEPRVEEHKAVVDVLRRHRFYRVRDSEDVRLSVQVDRDTVIFAFDQRPVLSLPVSEFMQQPDPVLNRLFMETDLYRSFRQLIYFSIILALPLPAFLLLYHLVTVISRRGFNRTRSDRSPFLLMLFILVIAAVQLFRSDSGSRHSPDTGVQSASTCILNRHPATDDICQKDLDAVLSITATQQLTRLPVPDRIRIAGFQGCPNVGSDPEILYRLLGDPSETVVCQAMRSLARSSSPQAGRNIRSILDTTQSWYLQDCAYRSLLMLR